MITINDALELMITFASLIVAVIAVSQKSNPPVRNRGRVLVNGLCFEVKH